MNGRELSNIESVLEKGQVVLGRKVLVEMAAQAVKRAAGFIVYRKTSSSTPFEFLLLQASYPPYHWTPPKGHVDPGEDEWAAAVRETQEEAGLSKEQIVVHEDFHETLAYEVVSNRYDANGVPVRVSKTVKYWLAELKQGEEVKLSEEHQKWRWCALDEALKLVAEYADMSTLLRKCQTYLESRS